MVRRLATLLVGSAALLLAAAPASADFGFVASLGAVGTNPGQFYRAAGIAFDPAGTHMYVADSGNNRVQRLNVPDGTPDTTGWLPGGVLTTRGPSATPLDHPVDVDVDDAGNLYVVEGADPSQPGFGSSWLVHKYDSSGGWLLTWGSEGSAAGKFQFPAGIATFTDVSGTVVYVAEGRNGAQERVQKFGSGGAWERTWGWGVKTGADAFEVCLPADAPCEPGSQPWVTAAGGG